MPIKLNFPRTYHRVYASPLEDSSVYTAKTDAEYYSLSGKTSYVGQIISVIDEEASSVTLYKIGTDKALLPIGETGLSKDAVVEILQQNGYMVSGDTLQMITDELSKIKIPSKVSELENDGIYLTENDLSDYAKKSDIPSLDNYVTEDELSTVSGITNGLYETVSTGLSKIKETVAELSNNVDKNSSDIQKVFENVKSLSGNTATNITDIKKSIEDFSEKTEISITKIETNINELSAKTNDITATIQTLSGNTNSALSTLHKYIDEQISGIPVQTVYIGDNKTILSKTNEDSSVIFSVIESALTISTKQVSGLSEEFNSLEKHINEEISSKISSVYKVKGSTDTYETLPTEDNVIGDVYNIVSSVTIDENFYPAGTNFVWTENGWDALGGTIDFSPYAKIEDVKNTISDINAEINNVSSSLSAFKTDVEKSGQTISDSISSLYKQITENTGLITDFSSITADHTIIIKNLSEKTDGFSNDITTITEKITSINQELSALKESDVSLSTELGTLSTSLTDTIDKLSKASDEIDGIKDSIKNLSETDTLLHDSITALSGMTLEHSQRLNALEDEIITDFSSVKIFNDYGEGFDEFVTIKNGNTITISFSGFDGGIIEIE